MPIRETEIANASIPTPAADKQYIFLDTDGIWKTKNEAGTVAPLGANSSPLTTKGDFWVWTSTNARLAAPANGNVWQADSAQTSGWVAYDLANFVSQTASVVNALANPSYVTLAATADLNNERVLTAGSNITIVDNGAGSTVVVSASSPSAPPKNFIVAVSDETTAITTGTAKVTFRMPYAMTLTGVRSDVNTASTSGTPTVDINITPAGSPSLPISILSTKLTIDAGELTSATAAVAAVISNSTPADNDEITIDIDVAGTGAKGLKVTFIGT